MAKTDFKSVSDYIAAQPPKTRRALVRVRTALRSALPTATEGISYQIPVYKLDGVMVLYFAGYQGHYSIYPATPRVVEVLGKDAAGKLFSKATLRFSLADAVPTALIRRVAKVRSEEALARDAKKATAKRSKTVSVKAPDVASPKRKAKSPARRTSAKKR